MANSEIQEVAGGKVIIIDGKICKLTPHGCNEWKVIPPEGYTAGRNTCKCTVIWITADISCSCGIQTELVLREISKE
jgi:hypothetical protein